MVIEGGLNSEVAFITGFTLSFQRQDSNPQSLLDIPSMFNRFTDII